MNTQKAFRIAVIGYGRLGQSITKELQKNKHWDIAYICDTHPLARQLAREKVPQAKIISNDDEIFQDTTLDAVALYTHADCRPEQIRKALKHGLHIIAEKPIAPDVKTEWDLVHEIEASNRLVAVNIFNRNAWYHKEIIDFIRSGEIGNLAIIRVCHMTPGVPPQEGYEPEGPPFRHCGMHYIDVARWYANSEYKSWHAQGISLWGHHEPWWVQVHGQFQNGVVFDVTQGFVYGQLAKKKIFNSYVDIIGTKGICRMHHDFKTATIELHGVQKTISKTADFGDKKLDVMVDLFAKSISAGRNLGFPTVRDAVIASDVSMKMYQQAIQNGSPQVGDASELQAILAHRKSLSDGFGLPMTWGRPTGETKQSEILLFQPDIVNSVHPTFLEDSKKVA